MESVKAVGSGTIPPTVWCTSHGTTSETGVNTANCGSDHPGGPRALLTADGAVRFLTSAESIEAASNSHFIRID